MGYFKNNLVRAGTQLGFYNTLLDTLQANPTKYINRISFNDYSKKLIDAGRIDAKPADNKSLTNWKRSISVSNGLYSYGGDLTRGTEYDPKIGVFYRGDNLLVDKGKEYDKGFVTYEKNTPKFGNPNFKAAWQSKPYSSLNETQKKFADFYSQESNRTVENDYVRTLDKVKRYGLDLNIGSLSDFSNLSDDRRSNLRSIFDIAARRDSVKYTYGFNEERVKAAAKRDRNKGIALGSAAAFATGGIAAGFSLGSTLTGALSGAASGAVTGGLKGALKGGVLGGVGGAATKLLSTSTGTAATSTGGLENISGFSGNTANGFAKITGNLTTGTAGASYVSGLVSAGLPVADGLATSFGTSLTNTGATKAGSPNVPKNKPNGIYGDNALGKAAQSNGANASTGSNKLIGSVGNKAIGQAAKAIAGKLLGDGASSSGSSSPSLGKAPAYTASSFSQDVRSELIGSRGTRRIFAGRRGFASELFKTKLLAA